MAFGFVKNLVNKIKLRQPFTEKGLVLENPDAQRWDVEVDVVIAGFGGAGAAAALESHEQGLKTLVLERFIGGGATAVSGGIYYAGGGTRIQHEAGVSDDPENMFNYLKQEVQGVVSDDTLRDFCHRSVDNFDWISKHGVPFNSAFCPFKTSYPPNQYYYYYSGNESFKPFSDHAKPAARGHRAHRKGVSGAAIFEPLRDSVHRAGIPVLQQTKVTGLFTNPAGEVVGVKAITLMNSPIMGRLHRLLSYAQVMLRYNAMYFTPLFPLLSLVAEWMERSFGQAYWVRARKGVILSTGGFFVNQKMIQDSAPGFFGGAPLGTAADDGSGIIMGQSVGGVTGAMDSVSAWRFINPPQAFGRGLLVGPSGKRICNEMYYGAQTGELMMRHHDGRAYLIIDSRLRAQAIKDLNLKNGLWFHVLLGWFYLLLQSKKADAIPELAAKLGISTVALQQSVNAYNQVARSDEEDPMGKPKDYVQAIEQGPFYAIDCSYRSFAVPVPSLTLGGLKVEESSGRVVRETGEPISGLYAIGRTAVGIPSKGYVSGLSIADCVYSGRRAARHAAGKSQF